jgi:hypothetical protein
MTEMVSPDPQTGTTEPGTDRSGAALIANLQRQQKLLDLYLFVLDCCLRGGLAQWWRQAVGLPFTDPAQGLERLKELCLHDLLYDAGDIAAFCRTYEILATEGYLEGDDHGRYLLELMQFVRRMLKDKPLHSRRRHLAFLRRKQAVVSVVIPDGPSLSNFQEFCLPSLQAKAGLKKLRARRAVTLLVFAPQRDITEIETYLRQKGRGWRIVCRPIPESLCGASQIVPGGVERDWLIGALQYLHLVEAKRLDADFHAINPSAVYGSGYLSAVLSLAKRWPAIVSAVTWINNRDLLEPKIVWQRDGAAEVLPVALSTLALNVCASASCETFVEGYVPIRGPTAQLRVMWRAKDRIDIHSTCHEIVFVARASLQSMPARFFIRPSAEMDRMLPPEVVPHVVTEEDGIAIAELRPPPGGFSDVGGDPAKLEVVVGRLARPRQAELFKRPVRLAVSLDEEPQGMALRDAFHASLATAGMPIRPSADQALSALHVLHHYEISEYGLENMAGAIAEGRRLIDLCSTTDLDEAPRKALIRAAMNFDHVDMAITLAKQGRESTSFIHEFLAKMMELRTANEVRARAIGGIAPRPSFAVIGSIAWGGAFVDKFMNYHVPSLLAADNLPALARKKRVVHSIVTTETDRQSMIAHPGFKRLSECAEVVFTCFPEKFLEQRERDHYNFYHFYGLLDHQSVFLASALRADLYLLPVDIVLSRDSLANLSRRLEQGADCCSVAGIECEPDQLRAWLDGQSRGAAGSLDLPADELLTAAIARPDGYFRSLVMAPENRAFCRYPRELIWPMLGGLVIHSIFMHPLAVSGRLLARPFHPQYENVDFALLPRLLQEDGRLEVLRDGREMVLAQFGAPAAREEFLDSGFSLEAFLDAHRYDYAAQRRSFAVRQFFPSKDLQASPSTHYQSDMAWLQAALERYRFRVEP